MAFEKASPYPVLPRGFTYSTTYPFAEVLEHVAEGHVVHRERSTVNLEDERVFLGGIEAGRLDDPALDTCPATRPVPDLVDRREPLVAHDVVVHVGQTREGGRRGLFHVDPHHVRRMLQIGRASCRERV